MDLTNLAPQHREAFVVDENGCWIWQKCTDRNGYGILSLKKPTPKTWKAHRYFYTCLVGPIPEGLVIDHLCRVPSCVNPDHLEPVTQRENLLRGDTLPARQLKRDLCPQGHEYDYIDPRGGRQCRACRAQALRKFRQR